MSKGNVRVNVKVVGSMGVGQNYCSITWGGHAQMITILYGGGAVVQDREMAKICFNFDQALP